MAAGRSKRKLTAAVDYQQLNSFPSVVLYSTGSKKRKTYPTTYIVERILSRRTFRHDHEYLIKWDGWPVQHCTWEPSCHLTPELLKAYNNPERPFDQRMHESSRQFYSAILSGLRSKSSSPVFAHVDHDVWRYISHNKGVPSQHKGYAMFSKGDFHRFDTLPEHWWYFLNEHSQGKAVRFPLKVKPVLTWTPAHQVCRNGKVVVAAKVPLQKLCIHIIKRPCDVNNLFEVE